MQEYTFRVFFVLNSENTQVITYQAPSVSQLLRTLDRAEGVNTDTVRELCVHWVKDDGTVVELIDFDKKKGSTAFLYTEPSSIEGGTNVVPFVPKKKPRVRLAAKNPDNPVVTTVCFGRYSVKEAK